MWRSYAPVIPSEQWGILFVLEVLNHVRNKLFWQRSGPKFRPVLPVTTVSLSAARPAHQVTRRPTNCITKHTTFCPLQSIQPIQKSVTSVRAEEWRIAAKLAVTRREDSCGEAYEQSVWIWHQHYRKAEHVFRQWRTRTQRYFQQEKLIVWEGVLIRRCQQLQHSDNLRCMLDTCNTWLRPHKKMGNQVRSFESLIFCSYFSSSRLPNTTFRQISLNQTRPQNWITDGLLRTQLTALL
jgi:hypothetical protein